MCKIKFNPATVLTLILALSFIESLATTALAGDEKKKNPSPDAASDIAIVMRVVKSVDVRQLKAAWQKAERGKRLNSGDDVRTGLESASILRFVDGTVIRVQQNSELKIRGEKDAAQTKMDKGIDLNLGKLGFDVKKRPDEQFRFVSPTSVASIKGTDGIFTSEGERSVLTILTTKSKGEAADFESTVGAKQKKSVFAGQTAVVNNQTGEIDVHPSSPDEVQQAKIAGVTSEEKKGKVIIKFRTPQGDVKEIELEER